MKGTYYRWTERPDGRLEADILGMDVAVIADQEKGKVSLAVSTRPLSPDEARLIGVRLIEAAALADGDRSVRSI